MLVVPPLTFLGGSFYSINMLPPFWQTVSHFNPVLYLVSGFRWSFYEIADVNPVVSLGMITLFLVICLSTSWAGSSRRVIGCATDGISDLAERYIFVRGASADCFLKTALIVPPRLLPVLVSIIICNCSSLSAMTMSKAVLA
jgi:hypothetical protein